MDKDRDRTLRRRRDLAQARAARSRRNPRWGLLLIMLGVGVFLVPFTVAVVRWLGGDNSDTWWNQSGAILLTLLIALTTRGVRMRVRTAEQRLADDGRAPVVFLRPFDLYRSKMVHRASTRMRMSPRERFEPTYERRLARTLNRIGPFVAIGDPTERLPQLGAARLYTPDDQWQQRVDELLELASVVLLHVGDRPGIAWEVSRVVGDNLPERILLSLPLDAPRRERSRQERWTAFLARYGPVFPQPLPDTIGDSQFLCFDHEWRAHLLGVRGAPPPSGEDPRSRAARALVREFKVTWGPRWARATVYTLPLTAWMAWIVIQALVGQNP